MTNYAKILLSVLCLVFLLSFIQCSKIDSDWYEDEKQNNIIQPPEEVMNTIGVKEGMVIGEFGAGYGRYTLHLAARVGKNGLIYANDIEESSLSFLSQRCKEAGLKNVKTILGKTDDPLFPKGSLDMAFSTLVYHELKHPITLMKNLRPALKPNALVVIVDYDPKKNKEKSNVGRDWEKEFDEAGFEIVKSEKLHERDVIFILKAKAQ